MKLHNISLEQAIGRISLICGGMLFFSLLFPIVPASTTAVDCHPGDASPCATKTAESYVDVEIIPTISLALNQRLDLEIAPTASGTTQVGTSSLQVATNHPDGYSIFMAARNVDSEGKASLMNNTTNTKIDPIPTSSATLPMNTWGYKLTQTAVETPDALYQAVPTDTTLVKQVSTTSFADQFSLDFGVAVDTSLPAGFYGNSVMISVVANPRIVRTLADLHYMQDMTTTLCEQTPGVEQDEKYKLNPVTKQLIDARDGKKYWVAKLADGHCWMTQNLALNLDTNKPLTPADSDVVTGWVPPHSTVISDTVTISKDELVYNTVSSWNFGEYVIIKPQSSINCDAPTGQPMSSCASVQNVANWQPTFNAQQGPWDDYTGYVAANAADQTYDAHYLTGNYYSWTAAIAGNTNNSICPKGWKLSEWSPTNGYRALIAAYGYPLNQDVAIDYSGATRVDGEPLFFARAGVIAGNGITASYLGDGIYYWTKTVHTSNSRAYYWSSWRSTIDNSASNGPNYIGTPIRCLAR